MKLKSNKLQNLVNKIGIEFNLSHIFIFSINKNIYCSKLLDIDAS